MYIEFEKWLNNILEENIPIPGAAINFNLYEEVDLYWSIQLICASYFDEADEDWCCEEGWEEIFDISCQMIKQYISEGKYAEELKKYEAISAGFVDGDLKILYQK